MIKLGPEPEGFLLRRADILAWLPGLTRRHWKKLRRTLREIPVPGCERPFYAKAEVKAKLITPYTEKPTQE